MITGTNFKNLLKPTEDYVVSLYLPTHPDSPGERNQDKTRLKNLLDEAESDLLALGGKRREVARRLRPARELVKDEPFWRQAGRGLAVFVGPEETTSYFLPAVMPETVVTAKRYHIKPLLPLLDINRHFYVLCVSPNQVSLFRADLENITPLESENLPENINDALGEDDNERTLQHFVAATGGSGSAAMYHGHGGAKDLSDIDPPRFIRAVAGAVAEELKDVEAPLVFAGDDRLFSLYGDLSRQSNLLDEHLSGNFDDPKVNELHQKALGLVTPRFHADIGAAAERYLQVAARNPELAAEELVRVAEAALAGKVEELLMNGDKTRWGKVGDNLTIAASLNNREPGAVDLFDLAAAATLEHGGRVRVAARDDVPGASGMAAVLRR